MHINSRARRIASGVEKIDPHHTEAQIVVLRKQLDEYKRTLNVSVLENYIKLMSYELAINATLKEHLKRSEKNRQLPKGISMTAAQRL